MYTCEFCGNEYYDEGFQDLEPLCDEGSCCESCYMLYVIPAKMKQAIDSGAYEDDQWPEDDDEDMPYIPGSGY